MSDAPDQSQKGEPDGPSDDSSSAAETSSQETKQNKNKWLKPVLILAVATALFFVTRYLGIGEKIEDLRVWIESLGKWGPLAFVGFYIFGVVTALPGSVLTLSAGVLFGTVMGTALVSLSSTIGAGLCFLIARYLARDTAARWLSKNDKFRKLDEMSEKHGAIVVALTRLVPIFPFNLLNYGFGLTRVKFKTYLFWSWLCMLPGTAMYVASADAVTTGVSEGGVPWNIILALLGIFVIIFFAVRFAKSRLKED